MTRNTYLTCLILLGCTGTRTGNPDGAPSYESGSRFIEEPTGGATGHPDGPCWPAGVPPYREMGGDLASLAGDDLIVAVEDRGLVVVDVSDPSAPALRGEVAFRGQPLQLFLDADAGAATLALRETNAFDEPVVPSEPPPREVVRLVRFDLANRAAPRRVYDLDVVDTFWQLETRGDRVFLLEQVIDAPPETCHGGAQVLIGSEGDCPAPTAMRVTAYDVGPDAFVEREAIEVSAAWNTASVAGDAFFIVANYGGPDATLPQTLAWIDFASGALVEGGPVTLPGRPQALARRDDTLALLLEDRVDAGFSLGVVTLSGTTGTLRGSVDLAGNLTAVSFDPAGFVVVDGAVVELVDVSDPDAPVLASTLPADVKRLVATGAGSLGFGSSDGAEWYENLVVSLWDLSDPSNPVRVADVTTDWFVHTDERPWTVDEDNGRLLLPLNRPPNGPDDPFELAVFSFDAASLVLESTQPSRLAKWHNVLRPLTDGTSVFAPSVYGLEVFPLAAGLDEPEPLSTLLRFRAEDALDSLDVSGTTLSLHERGDDGVFELVIEPGDGPPATIELDHRADALVEVEGGVAVLGLRGEASECEYFLGMGIDPSEIPEFVPNQNGVNPCLPHRMRGVSVVALGDAPRVVQTFPITAEMDVEPIEGVRVRSNWPGYLRLPDGRLALLAERTQQCDSYALCEVLGVPAYESMGSPGCNPETQDCSMLPAVQTFVSGYKSSLAVYVLDGTAGDAPELALGPVLDGSFSFESEWSLDLSWQALPNDAGLAFAREESIYDEHGNSVVDAHENAIVRYFLERVVFAEDGTLGALAPVNTPGLPVALDADHVYSAEPGYDADGTISVEIHRSELRDGGAYVEASLDLRGGFSEVRAFGEHLLVLRGPPDWCAEDVHTDLFAVSLPDEDISLGTTLALPGSGWLFPYGPLFDEDGHLVLWGGPFGLDGRLSVDVADPFEPRILRYARSLD